MTRILFSMMAPVAVALVPSAPEACVEIVSGQRNPLGLECSGRQGMFKEAQNDLYLVLFIDGKEGWFFEEELQECGWMSSAPSSVMSSSFPNFDNSGEASQALPNAWTVLSDIRANFDNRSNTLGAEGILFLFGICAAVGFLFSNGVKLCKRSKAQDLLMQNLVSTDAPVQTHQHNDAQSQAHPQITQQVDAQNQAEASAGGGHGLEVPAAAEIYITTQKQLVGVDPSSLPPQLSHVKALVGAEVGLDISVATEVYTPTLVGVDPSSLPPHLSQVEVSAGAEVGLDSSVATRIYTPTLVGVHPSSLPPQLSHVEVSAGDGSGLGVDPTSLPLQASQADCGNFLGISAAATIYTPTQEQLVGVNPSSLPPQSNHADYGNFLDISTAAEIYQPTLVGVEPISLPPHLNQVEASIYGRCLATSMATEAAREHFASCMFEVVLDHTSGASYGAKFVFDFRDGQNCIVVACIKAGGLIDAWNQHNVDGSNIEAGDHILAVSGITEARAAEVELKKLQVQRLSVQKSSGQPQSRSSSPIKQVRTDLRHGSQQAPQRQM